MPVRLAPINNPHSKTGQVQKKTKAEERDELADEGIDLISVPWIEKDN